MTTLQDALTHLRDLIDEPTAVYWTDDQLTVYLNDGTRDVARKAEDIISFNTSVTAVAGTYLYALPSDTLRVHRVEFQPSGQTQVYPLQLTNYDDMDQIWGINQQIQSSYPSWVCIRGYPGGTQSGSVDSRLVMQVFPVPSTAGTFNLFVYRQPYQFLPPSTNPGELAKTVEVPGGWDDLPVWYAAYKAMVKNRDERWKELRQTYLEDLEYLIQVSRTWPDAAGRFSLGSPYTGAGIGVGNFDSGSAGWW